MMSSLVSTMLMSVVDRSARRSLALALTVVALGSLSGVARALPEAKVSEKLDTILMLMAVNDKGLPVAVKASIDGKVTDAYLAAISIAAAEEITAGKRYGLDAATATSRPRQTAHM